MPAVTHGHAMMRSGQGAQALAMTSTGSFLAVMIGLGVLVALYHSVAALSVLFQTRYLVPMFLTILAMMILTTPNKILSLIMMILGLVLGKVGYDSLHAAHFLVPQHTAMDAGIPFFPLFAGLVVVPLLIDFIRSPARLPGLDLPRSSVRERLQNLLAFRAWASMLRGGVVGSVVGLIPGASYMTSSNVAESVERRYSDQAERLLISAESANNAAAITVLIPLLVFAIPIIPSEAVALSIAEGLGFGITTSLVFVQQHLLSLIVMLLAVSTINWLLAGYFYQAFASLYHSIRDWIYPALLIVVMALMMVVAWWDHQLMFSMAVFVVALIFGIVLRDPASKMVMIFSFFLSDSVLDEIYRFVIIYF